MQESLSRWDALQEKCPHVIDVESGKDLEPVSSTAVCPTLDTRVSLDCTGIGSFKWMGPLPTRSLSGSPPTFREVWRSHSYH